MDGDGVTQVELAYKFFPFFLHARIVESVVFHPEYATIAGVPLPASDSTPVSPVASVDSNLDMVTSTPTSMLSASDAL